MPRSCSEEFRAPLPAPISVLALAALVVGLSGCGESAPKEIAVPPSQNNLRQIVLAYNQAAIALNRPPHNVEDIRTHLAKLGDVKDVLRSPNGEEYVIQWGYDARNTKMVGDAFPIWIYEKSATNGKRWVVRDRFSLEMTDEELRNALFAPGMKKPF